MILKHLSIFNYKNIAEAELDFSKGVNCFIGNNGEGKTNLLDAVYFLSLCKSSTSSQDSLCISHDADCMALQGKYLREDNTEENIHCACRRGQKKILRRDKKPYKRLAEHIGLIPLVMVSPSDQMLIAGGSEERRRFMDLIISQCDLPYLDTLNHYNRVLQQRNILLKKEEEPDEELMHILEEQMATAGHIIFNKRKAYIEAFEPIFQHYYTCISEEKEQVTLQYISHGQRGNLLDIIQRDRAKDRAVGYSLHGTHRDDLEMLLGNYQMKREGSQGQNKTFLIALKLAQFDFLLRSAGGTKPLLLLDDIFDRLDARRVEQIVRLVSSENFGQIFITDTNRDNLDHILKNLKQEYCLFHVKEGIITKQT